MSVGDSSTPSSEVQSGIYRITCTASGKFYIGSAVDLRRRWNRHQSELESGSHHNSHLQNAWRKYGPGCFVFEIVESVADASRLIEVEQDFLDRLRPFDPNIGYNISPTAIAPVGIECSPETRAKLSASTKRMMSDPNMVERIVRKRKDSGYTHSPETRAKLSKRSRENAAADPECIDRMLRAKGVQRRTDKPKPRAKMAKTPDGYRHTDETKAKISEASRNRSPETRAKISESSKRQMANPDRRNQIAEYTRKNGVSEETRQKLSLAQKKRSKDPDEMAKRSAQMAAMMADPEFRARAIENLKNGHSPEAIAKGAEARRGMKHSPEAIAKMSAAKKGKKMSAESRAKMSAYRKGRKQSPEHIANHKAAMARRRAAQAAAKATSDQNIEV